MQEKWRKNNMGVVPIRKMPAIPAVVVVAIVVFASPCCTAGRPATAVDAAPKPLVENLPASPAALDFIRARCEQCSRAGGPEDAKMCYELLLPYAASINGSYNRAAIAGVTVMLSKLTAFKSASPPPQGECIQVVNGAISGAQEPLSKLGRLDAMGDDKVDAGNPDLVDVAKWASDVNHYFIQSCRDGGSAAAVAVGDSVSNAVTLLFSARPYWGNLLPSPDGA